MSKQKLFNKAYLGLKSQGFQLSSDKDGCMYRSESGNRCSIGWCISDKKYSRSFEGNDVFGIPFAELFPRISEVFLMCLQECHDNVASDLTMKRIQSTEVSQKIERNLIDFANSFGLTVPE
jgi:hypothetical protein